jgi:hypothetical protein
LETPKLRFAAEAPSYGWIMLEAAVAGWRPQLTHG